MKTQQEIEEYSQYLYEKALKTQGLEYEYCHQDMLMEKSSLLDEVLSDKPFYMDKDDED